MTTPSVAPAVARRTRLAWFRSGSLAADSVVAGALTTGRLALSFLAGVAIARALGAEGRGEVVFVVTCAALVALAGAAGVAPATTRARSAMPGASLVRPVLVITALRVAVVAAAATAAWLVIAGGVGPVAGVPRVALVASLAMVVALQTAVAGLAGVAGRSVLVSGAYAAGTATFALALAVLGLGGHLRVDAVLLLWVLTSGAGAGLVAVALRDQRPTAPNGAILRWSMHASWGDLALSAAWRLDNFLIGASLGFGALARYSAAVAVAEVALALTAGVRLAMMRSPHADPRAAARTAVRLTVMVGVPFALVASVVGPAAIRWTFGPEFSGLGVVLVSMLPGTVALGLSHVFIDQLTAAGSSALVAASGVAALLLNLAGNLVLLPSWGITGAAVASTLAYTGCAASLWWALHRSTPSPSPSLAVVAP